MTTGKIARLEYIHLSIEMDFVVRFHLCSQESLYSINNDLCAEYSVVGQEISIDLRKGNL